MEEEGRGKGGLVVEVLVGGRGEGGVSEVRWSRSRRRV